MGTAPGKKKDIGANLAPVKSETGKTRDKIADSRVCRDISRRGDCRAVRDAENRWGAKGWGKG